jgi:hypothetical protein
MKHLKTYEYFTNLSDAKFKVGDYVKLTPRENIHNEIKDFLNNNIGQIHNIEFNKFGKKYYFYNVRYDNVPKNIFKYTRYMGSMTDGLKEQGEIFTADKENLIRLATPEEIEIMKVKKDSEKYNI